jgi:hypothetical protein
VAESKDLSLSDLWLMIRKHRILLEDPHEGNWPKEIKLLLDAQRLCMLREPLMARQVIPIEQA